ncbi:MULTISPECIES: aminotransferase class V-fold PLP-dependent enzyme [unclassified Pseudoalteromonas]|uniref:aminotransferase class V-fold PLP-dependent enzyme n=1 Tax=unclassified Pseudoalteromonas TaxID=194690 RepID=UPI002096FED6|nr:aminotransferase class V-fold PLP-dependent enzyme [Pseudoalteromonas sp. XMcav2-N]MCO7191315.1 aminotransferase class V-fold PLP-dependent enzyme [Pseudoalteromonas sp. XMcav2-N]
MKQADFSLPQGHYLLSHSVGRPLATAEQDFMQRYFHPWAGDNHEPWYQWLDGIQQFTSALARLFNSPADYFCPQSNLSSGLTKFVMSLPETGRQTVRVLMSESDFPSMGFVLQQAVADVEIHFIPADLDMSDLSVWQQHLHSEIDWVFVSQVYSNTGQQAPVAAITTLAKAQGCRVIVDIAQAAGVIPIDLSDSAADCVLGSCVKWLCGGPGAGFIWVNPDILAHCQPKDVGWFSHQNPMEFDIHHFAPHDSALRFWGGTPSVAAYIFAAHSIHYFADLGVAQVRAHNLTLLARLQAQLAPWYIAPTDAKRCSGTAILNAGEAQDSVLSALREANIAVDARKLGIRVSPHIYNTEQDIDAFITIFTRAVSA